MRIVGREDALAVLASALDRIRGGRPALVAVEGAAGIGKTTLIGGLLAAAAHARLARVSGWESEALVRYGVTGACRHAPERAGAASRAALTDRLWYSPTSPGA